VKPVNTVTFTLYLKQNNLVCRNNNQYTTEDLNTDGNQRNREQVCN